VNIRACSFLTDQNINLDVVEWMRNERFDVITTRDEGMSVASDRSILKRATTSERAVITHDADFGKLAIADASAIYGIVYLRPGHVRAEPVIDTLRALFDAGLDVTPPFIVVARWTPETVFLRHRQLPAG
jgi:predicted nuclease of predicted toxin-antitoxin system